MKWYEYCLCTPFLSLSLSLSLLHIFTFKNMRKRRNKHTHAHAHTHTHTYAHARTRTRTHTREEDSYEHICMYINKSLPYHQGFVPLKISVRDRRLHRHRLVSRLSPSLHSSQVQSCPTDHVCKQIYIHAHKHTHTRTHIYIYKQSSEYRKVNGPHATPWKAIVAWQFYFSECNHGFMPRHDFKLLYVRKTVGTRQQQELNGARTTFRCSNVQRSPVVVIATVWRKAT